MKFVYNKKMACMLPVDEEEEKEKEKATEEEAAKK